MRAKALCLCLVLAMLTFAVGCSFTPKSTSGQLTTTAGEARTEALQLSAELADKAERDPSLIEQHRKADQLARKCADLEDRAATLEAWLKWLLGRQ